LRDLETIEELYPYQAWRNTKNWMAGGMHILSKYPFEEISWEKATSGWFPGWIIRFRKDSKTGCPFDFLALSVHLRPPLSSTSSMPFGLSPYEYFVQSPKHHKDDLLQWLSVLKEAIEAEEGTVPYFVLGDFNEQENGTGYQILRGEGLCDARAEFDGNKCTWTWPITSFYNTTARYDHLFYTPDSLRCLGAKVLQEGPSDHYPVVGEFCLVEE